MLFSDQDSGWIHDSVLSCVLFMYNPYMLSWLLLKYLSSVRYKQHLVVQKLQDRENAVTGRASRGSSGGGSAQPQQCPLPGALAQPTQADHVKNWSGGKYYSPARLTA